MYVLCDLSSEGAFGTFRHGTNMFFQKINQLLARTNEHVIAKGNSKVNRPMGDSDVEKLFFTQSIPYLYDSDLEKRQKFNDLLADLSKSQKPTFVILFAFSNLCHLFLLRTHVSQLIIWKLARSKVNLLV